MIQSFKPICAEQDALLLENPDRGFRLEVSFAIRNLAEKPGSFDEKVAAAAEGLRRNLEKSKPEKIKLAQVYMYLDGYRKEPLPDEAFTAMDVIFEALRVLKLKAVLRYAYARNILDESTDADQDIVICHIRQLGPVLRRNTDVIHVLQAGFVGAWGEWHSDFYVLDRTTVINTILDELAPENIYVQMREPEHRNRVSPSHPAYRRMGYHIDAFFGRDESGPTPGSGGLDCGTEAWEQVAREAPFAPTDGELYWTDDKGSYHCDGYLALKEFAEQRFTSFSVLHGYKDKADHEELTTMYLWKNQELTEDWLRSNHICYCPSWFRDAEGRPVQRSVFEYVRDYLGYKLEAQQIDVRCDNRPGAALDVDMPLINYGLSAAFNLESRFVLLDEQGQAVRSVRAGTPSEWYSHDPHDPFSDVLLTHHIAARMTLPKKKGLYRLTFVLQNSCGDFARLGNELEYRDGYHFLCDIPCR